MVRVEQSVLIRASRDRVWDIISDLDNEGEYWWGTREVRNISREGNTISREIVQNFRNHRIPQKVTLYPKDSIEIQYLKGLTQGVKILSIEPQGDDMQKVRAYWDVHFAGIYRLASPLIKRHVERGTVDALQRIKEAAEKVPAQAG